MEPSGAKEKYQFRVGLSSRWKLPNLLSLVNIELSSLDWVVLNVD
jgi:hypothetical protein